MAARADRDANPYRVRNFVLDLEAHDSRFSGRSEAPQASIDRFASHNYIDYECAVRRAVARVRAEKREKAARDA